MVLKKVKFAQKVYKYHLPNYKDGSIVNLMSSIKKSFGGKSLYQPLKNFDIEKISGKSVIVFIIDGLGYKYLKKYGDGSFLYENLKGEMTSVLPATTASAVTSFATGLAPQQHGITGWFMYLKEIGVISAILPFTNRADNLSLDENLKYQDIYNQGSFFEGLKVDSFYLNHKNYSDSSYSRATSAGAKRLKFSNASDFFKQVEDTFKKDKRRKFMLAYWAKFDSICHHKGTESKEAFKHFSQLNRKIAKLSRSLRSSDTTIIVTADHGLIDTIDKNKIIKLENHPKLVETLSMPLSGEPRIVYCYVKSQKVKQFEDYVKTKLSDVCDIYKSEELIQKNYFGLFEPNKKLKDRVGDYILIMKDNYIMKDFVLGEDQNILIGNHGGVSREEMIVPLIII